MSIIHVNQIRSKISSLFSGLIDLDGVPASGPERDNYFLTRALAAYSIYFLSGADPKVCASAVTDGGDDNGVDAIYFHSGAKVLYLVQSKWIHNGSGEPDNGSMKKFVVGIRDLFNCSFDRFNQKVRDKKTEIMAALEDPETTYQVVIVYTGINKLAAHSSRDLEDLLSEMNDTSEVLAKTVLNQTDLYKSLASGIAGKPINLGIGLRYWGKIDSPFTAFYGQVYGAEIADWWQKHQTRLFDKNLRNSLGETEVNSEIRETIQKQPELFWFFNNGITIVCDKAEKDMVGGANRDFGKFHCENISIVNGAQTVTTIGKFFQASEKKESIDKVYVPLRIIALEGNDDIGAQITKTNNRQNKIENRDFVRQDPEQMRIKTELAMDNIHYHLMRSDLQSTSAYSFDLVESTTALVCASGDPKLVVQLKREVGKLWEDISKAPYKAIFNSQVSGLYVWRCVQVQRIVDQKISAMSKSVKGRDFGIAIHGNRIISAITFGGLPLKSFQDSNFMFDKNCSAAEVERLTEDAYEKLCTNVNAEFSKNTVLPTLFKNAGKCAKLFGA